MQFRVLGPVEITDAEGRSIDIGGAQPRAVLTMLLTAGDRVVPAEAIVDRLWPGSVPASATSTLQSYISRLRRALQPHAGDGGAAKLLVWEPPGYRLRLDDEAVDFRRFERDADHGRRLLAAGSAERAESVLAAALELWRGPALLEFADQPWAAGVATRLEERRLAAIEDRTRAALHLGRHDEVVGDLTDLVHQHPLREGLWELFALALYRAGRQAEALRALEDVRRQLLEQLGVDPGRGVRELESRILAHDPAIAAPPSPAAPTGSTAAAPARGGRHFSGLAATPMIGRVGEREQLEHALDLAAQGRMIWAVIEGEAGIGKTRLAEHVADEATRRGFDVLWGRSYESGPAPAFWLWLPVLRSLEHVVRELPDHARDVLLQLLAPDRDESIRADTDQARFRLFEAIALLLERAGEQRPLLIALDDAQWADPASFELIELLAGYVIAAPIVILATVRDVEIGRNERLVRALAQVSRRPLAARVRLSGLDPEQTLELVGQSLRPISRVTTFDPEVARAIHSRSEGNPFYAVELARLVAHETGTSRAEQVRRVAVPIGVRDVVHRRIATIAPVGRELIQSAAVLGRQVHVRTLGATAGVPLDTCLDQLEPAINERILVESDDEPGVVRFSHGLVREVVLDEMSVLRRSRLHLRAADAIEDAGVVDDDAEIVAEHLWQASSLGVQARAAAALERAAGVAARRYAYETADDLLERALQLRRALPAAQKDPNAELETINRLAAVRRGRFGYRRAAQQTPMERARALAMETGRTSVLAELLWTEWAGAATTGELPTARALAQEMLDLAATSDDLVIVSNGHACWGVQCWHEGRMQEAMRSLDRAVELLGPWNARQVLADGPLVGLAENQLLHRGFHALVHEMAGAPLGDPSPLVAVGTSPLQHYQLLPVWVSESIRALMAGDYATAERAAIAARALEVRENFDFWKSAAACDLGVAHAQTGRADTGVPLMIEGIAGYRAFGVKTAVPFYLAHLAEGHMQLGRLDEAEAALADAAEVLASSNELWVEPFLMTASAIIGLARTADTSSAGAALHAASARAAEQGSFGVAHLIDERARRLGVMEA